MTSTSDLHSDIVPTSRLLATGHSWSDIRHATRFGDLTRVFRGQYSWDPVEDDERLRHLRLIQAVANSTADDTVFSHQSAAALHGLPLPLGCEDVVTTVRPGRGGGRVTPHHRQQRLPLSADDMCVRSGFRVTSLARTAVDLAREHGLDYGVGVVDAAAALGVEAQEWTDVLARSSRRPGMAAARFAVAFRAPASESPGESLARLRFHQCGLPAPLLQFEIRDRDGRLLGRTDFAWPALRLLGEYDGEQKYGLDRLRPGDDPAEALIREKRREERICAEGWWFLRLMKKDLRSPARVAALWRQASEVAGRLRG